MPVIAYKIVEGEKAREQAQLAALCSRVFSDFDPNYLARLASVIDPILVQAVADGKLIGFKLGYRRGRTLFYSWLGGIDPEWRRQGIAEALTKLQHERLKLLGYIDVETRTRATSNAMLILNIRSGFNICGFEVDPHGIPVVTQRKHLAG